MEDFFAIPEDGLHHSSRALRRVFLRRGWKDVRVIRDGCILYFATRPDGKKMRFCTSAPSTMSHFAAKLADSKVASYLFLKEEGVAQPDTVWLSENREEWGEQIRALLEKYKRIVVKPSFGAHGEGVKTDITSVEEALMAAGELAGASRHHSVIAQEQLGDGITEIRAICVNYKLAGAYERIPAAVTGDGEHNILELIRVENKELRGEAYMGKPAWINEEEAKHYLEKNNVDAMRVPAIGEEVRVMRACNVGVGGTMRHVELSAERVALVEKIARSFELPLIGVDFYGDKVIEVNAMPALYCPTGDEWADECAERYVDYLESI